MSAKHRVIPVFVPHEGCTHACVFCNQREIAAKETAEALESLIETALLRAGEGPPPELAYYGGSFTAIPKDARKRYLAIARRFISKGKISSLRISTRPDAVSEETLSELLSCGPIRVELGAQSMDDRVLSISKRGHTAADTVRASELIRAKNIPLVLQMMAGLPGETPESPFETARELIRLSPEAVRIYPVAVIEGTELARMFFAGEYTPLTVSKAAEICAGLIDMFEEAGIPVIRVGLQPTEKLSNGGVIAGAYHPALGELSRSILYLNRARNAIREAGVSETMTLFTSPEAISLLVGQRRRNIEALKQEFGILKLLVKGVDIPAGVVHAKIGGRVDTL